MSKIVTVMSDSMRVGKTTAVKVIAEGMRSRGYKVTESYEDWQHNPYLKGSYADPEKNFLESQKWFVKRKLEQLSNVEETLLHQGFGREGIFVQDVPPEMDYNYALTNMRIGRMSAESFERYREYYQGLDRSRLRRVDLLVYLTVSDRELLQRATASRREFETVEEDYFLEMKRVNREWIKKHGSAYNLLKVDTNRLNFVSSGRDRESLVNMVINSLINR